MVEGFLVCDNIDDFDEASGAVVADFFGSGEFNRAFDYRVKSIIGTFADALARDEFGASLADDNTARFSGFSVGKLDSQIFWL